MSPPYVCGHSASELERLEIQGAFFAEISRRILSEGGIAPGMRVLDIGCGAGDVSFLAAELVGGAGHVVGIDRAPEAIAAARARAESRACRNVSFTVGEVAPASPAGTSHMTGTASDPACSPGGPPPDGAPFDAVIGRFVLMHQADPAATLCGAGRRVRRGGAVVMIESHMAACVAGSHSYPHSATYDGIVRWMTDTVRRAGAHADMGLRLRQAFLDAGLPTPRLLLESRVDGGERTPAVRYVTESLRSMLPLARELGVTSLTPDDVDALERELRSELARHGGVLVSWPVVGAWCSLP